MQTAQPPTAAPPAGPASSLPNGGSSSGTAQAPLGGPTLRSLGLAVTTKARLIAWEGRELCAEAASGVAAAAAARTCADLRRRCLPPPFW